MLRGTNYSTGGFNRFTRLVPQVKVRVLGFFLVVACGSLVLAWITNSLWAQLDELQRDHAAVRTESFYVGVQLRGALRALNDKLLQYGVSQDPTFRDAFLNDSAEVAGLLSTNRLLLAGVARLKILESANVSRQLRILDELSGNYDHYRSNAAVLIAESAREPVSARSFESTYKEVREISSGLFPLCDDLVSLEREGFAEFLRRTQDTLLKHQRLLTLSSVIILVLTAVLAVLVYRGMIAPLQVGLRESRSIIERQEKLASLGILASGVAHEIRNPLTAIKFRLFSLKKAVPETADNEDLSVIGSEIGRLEQIVQQFLQFARPADPVLTRVDLGRVIGEVRDLFRPQLQSSAIEVSLDLASKAEAFADVTQIKQILVNLVKNASESIGRNGTITLGLRREEAGLDGRMRPAAVISVADTGMGIPPDVEPRIFDPFFTTKEQGAGLGLAISARIAEKHGGMLRYQTQVNRGTVFELVIPAAQNDEHAG